MNTPNQNQPAVSELPLPKELKISKNERGHTTFTYKLNASAKSGLFVALVFIIFWNSVVYTIFFRSLSKKEWAEGVYMTPFILAGTFFFLFIIYSFFKKERITIQENSLEQFTGIGSLGKTKSYRFSGRDTIRLILLSELKGYGKLDLTGSSDHFELGKNMSLPALCYIRQEVLKAAPFTPLPDLIDNQASFHTLCPGCDQILDLYNTPIQDNTITCPQCGMTSPCNDLPYTNRVPLELPKKVTQHPAPEGVEIYEVKIRNYAGIASLFFVAIWYGLLSQAIPALMRDKAVSPVALLVLCLFLLAGLLPLFSGLYALFGKTIFAFGHGQGSYYSGIGPLGRTKKFTYSCEDTITSDSTKGTYYYISIQNPKGKEVHIGGMLHLDHADFIIERLKRSQWELRNTPPTHKS